MRIFDELRLPIVQAPMAGGPATVELAIAVSAAGGLGSIAAGYLSTEQFRELLDATFAHIDVFNVNVFVPEAHRATQHDLASYMQALREYAGVTVEDIPPFTDDAFDAKIDLLENRPPAVVTFTFGLPERNVIERIRSAGSAVGVTVTGVDEARNAQAAGADFVIVQSFEAGGHLSVHDQSQNVPHVPLRELVHTVTRAVNIPLLGAGGIGTVEQAQAVMDAGVAAVVLGTRFLTTREAGTKPIHAAALLNGEFNDTTQTRAFTGRIARALTNNFTRTMDPHTVVGYPQVHFMTGPMRKANAQNPHKLNLWAGTAFAQCKDQTVAQLMDEFRSLHRS